MKFVCEVSVIVSGGVSFIDLKMALMLEVEASIVGEYSFYSSIESSRFSSPGYQGFLSPCKCSSASLD